MFCFWPCSPSDVNDHWLWMTLAISSYVKIHSLKQKHKNFEFYTIDSWQKKQIINSTNWFPLKLTTFLNIAGFPKLCQRVQKISIWPDESLFIYLLSQELKQQVCFAFLSTKLMLNFVKFNISYLKYFRNLETLILIFPAPSVICYSVREYDNPEIK